MILAADLLKWIIPKIGRFPRQVRYGLGSRIEAAPLGVRGGLRDAKSEARRSSEKPSTPGAAAAVTPAGSRIAVFTWPGTRCGPPPR